MHILGVGDPFVDLTAHVDNSFLEELNVKPGTRFVIDYDFFSKHTKRLKPLICRTGGSTANAIVSLACMNMSASFSGCVGDDEYGRFFRDWMSELGVGDNCVTAENGLPTSRSLNLITPNGERTMAVLIGASKCSSAAQVNVANIRDKSHILCELYQLFARQNRRVLLETLDIADRLGKVFALGLSDVSCINIFPEETKALVAKSNVVFGNEFEWRAYYKTTILKEAVERAAGESASRKNSILVVTCGENGAYITDGKGGYLHVESVPPDDHEINLTGAGDSFAAGFLYGLAHKASLRACGELGAKVASVVINKERATLIQQEGQLLADDFQRSIGQVESGEQD